MGIGKRWGRDEEAGNLGRDERKDYEEEGLTQPAYKRL